MEVLIIAITVGCICGLIGSTLGGFVDKQGAGFWLGFLLGPIGWIILFLLPRETNNHTQARRTFSATGGEQEIPSEPPCERNLDIDAYKIWLAAKYGIQKSNTFDQYICGDRLFISLEQALQHANSIEQNNYQALKEKKEAEEKAKEEEARLIADRNKIREEKIARVREEHEVANKIFIKKMKKALSWVIPAALICISVFFVIHKRTTNKYIECMAIHHEKINITEAELQHVKSEMAKVSKELYWLRAGENLYAEGRKLKLYLNEFNRVLFLLNANKDGNYLLEVKNNSVYFVKSFSGQITVTEKGSVWPKAFLVSQDNSKLGAEYVLKPHDSQYVKDFSGHNMPVINKDELKREVKIEYPKNYYTNITRHGFKYATLDTTAEFSGEIVFIQRTQTNSGSENGANKYTEVNFDKIARTEYQSFNDYSKDIAELVRQYSILEKNAKDIEQYMFTLSRTLPKKTFFGVIYNAM